MWHRKGVSSTSLQPHASCWPTAVLPSPAWGCPQCRPAALCRCSQRCTAPGASNAVCLSLYTQLLFQMFLSWLPTSLLLCPCLHLIAVTVVNWLYFGNLDISLASTEAVKIWNKDVPFYSVPSDRFCHLATVVLLDLAEFGQDSDLLQSDMHLLECRSRFGAFFLIHHAGCRAWEIRVCLLLCDPAAAGTSRASK